MFSHRDVCRVWHDQPVPALGQHDVERAANARERTCSDWVRDHTSFSNDSHFRGILDPRRDERGGHISATSERKSYDCHGFEWRGIDTAIIGKCI